MPRITEAELRKLFPLDGADKDVSHYIADANVLITDILGASTLAEPRLALLEKFLAAHLYVLAEQEGGIFEENIGTSSEKRGSTFTLGQGLKLTRWGQMVLSLDTTGTFLEETTYSTTQSNKKQALFRLV